jgi:hypothetical protein
LIRNYPPAASAFALPALAREPENPAGAPTTISNLSKDMAQTLAKGNGTESARPSPPSLLLGFERIKGEKQPGFSETFSDRIIRPQSETTPVTTDFMTPRFLPEAWLKFLVLNKNLFKTASRQRGSRLTISAAWFSFFC